jgi:hypothetical protein
MWGLPPEKEVLSLNGHAVLNNKLTHIVGIPMSKSNTVTGNYADACAKAAASSGVSYVDLYHEMMKVKV